MNQLPEQFIKRLQQILTPSVFEDVLKSFTKKQPPSFRVNTLKTSRQNLYEDLARQGFQLQSVPWYADAFILKNKSQKDLCETLEYQKGSLYLQNLSSMIPPLVLSPSENERILDLTAAPGSKTSQIAAMMKNMGQIVANDKSKIRLYKLAANLTLLGVTNTQILNKLGQTLWQEYSNYFDKSLVDVPCSMEGRFLIDYPKSYNNWSVKKIKELVQTQRFLLRSAISATKPGGVIVYSTCTLSPEENEGVIDWILTREKGAVELEEISIDLPERYPSLTEWNNRIYNPTVTKCLRILPSEYMEGFFIAKLRRIQ